MPQTDKMPSSARLVAAVSLGLLGWIGSEMVRDLMPPHTAFGWFNYVNVGLGLLCGWLVIGSRVGSGYVDAISIGLTGAAALVFWGLFTQSFNLMLKQSLERKYDGPFEGIVGMFNNAVDYGEFLLDGTLIGVLVAGGILSGLLAEFVVRRWT
ncbi:TrgA family protein [Pseudohalocynthiibacter aestuariivivens]|uniref:TrgA family protein n=1 Tax=Roseovarius pelagicus TaxID=2980108 RepID=A0ABY6DAY4_9RHOB|nr:MULTISPECIES: TrgA family protein [Rhodobacterales]QIE44935.1 TrgA family protein [Pseudohalocynthiibacter aestuariivivens]UXX83149.1 TrgA family protein [Roseovarius pelagicus]